MKPSSLVLVVVLAVAACRSASTPPPATPPTAPTAEASAPAAPTGEVTAAELHALVDRLCACTDATCGERAGGELDAASRRPLAADIADVQDTEFTRAQGCFSRFLVELSHRDLLAVARRTADAVCACTTVACATEAGVAGANAEAEIPHHADDSLEHTRMDEAHTAESHRADACYRALPGAGDPSVTVTRWTRFAADVCTCAGAAACIDGHAKALRAEPTDPALAVFADEVAIHAAVSRALACGWPGPT